MMTSTQAPCATHYAEGLLRAWVTGDLSKLAEELDRGAELSPTPDNGWDEERVELVKAVAGQLKFLLNGGKDSSDEVRLRVCVGLLQNLLVQPDLEMAGPACH